MAQGWPLTGRSEELRLIGELGRHRDGPAGVVLAGAAGVGKTRLAREALAAARQRGALTRWAAATASARVLPLGAFAAMLGAGGPDPTRLVRQASEALLAGAGRSGVVIGVDDGHLLDELSAMLVHQLVLRRAATVVLTLRSGEPAPDAVTALWKDGHLRRVELQPLSDAETAELLEAALNGPVDSVSARRLWAITRGNPLYLRQLVEGECESGRLAEVASVWRWSGEPQLSPGLAELVQDRIGQLSEAQRDVVEILAFGEPLGVPLLAQLTDAEAVDQAEARGLVEVHRDGRRLQARLAHPLYGEVQRARCGQLRARRLRSQIATALADTGARRKDDTLRRAVLAIDSDLAPDPELLTVAAQRAIELFDCGLTERLARAALTAGGGFAPRLTLSVALIWMSRGAEADAELAILAELGSTDGERSQAAATRVSNLLWTLARPAEAEAALASARVSARGGAPGLELAAIGSVLDSFLGRTIRAAAAAAEVLANPHSSPDALILATWGLVTAAGGLGRVEGLAEAVECSAAAPGSLHLGLVRIGAVGELWLRALRLAGALDAAEEVARRYVELLADGTDPLRSMMTAAYGQVARDRGQVRTAVHRLREAAPAALVPGWSFYLPLSLAPALGMAGDAAGARSALAEAEAARHPSFVFMEPDLLLARAWVAAAEGVLSEAVARAREAAVLAAQQEQPAVEVVALHTAVCFGDRTVADRLAELATQVDGPRAPAAAAHAAALATDDGDALLAASHQLEQMGALLLAADAAAQAASAHTRHDRRGSAHATAARAHALAQQCEGARTPALREAAAPLPLTAREREIVILAAAGLSNRNIAARLVVSVRTVEGHLYRACAKLGAPDRTKLAGLLGVERLAPDMLLDETGPKPR